MATKETFPHRRNRQNSLVSRRFPVGFTLAELLVAIGILGVIATFTIPKVLQAQQVDHRKNVFKETYAALYDVGSRGKMLGLFTQTG